jgi:hypothetical protein
LNPGLHHRLTTESWYYTLNTNTHNQEPTGSVDKSQMCKSIQFIFAWPSKRDQGDHLYATILMMRCSSSLDTHTQTPIINHPTQHHVIKIRYHQHVFTVLSHSQSVYNCKHNITENRYLDIVTPVTLIYYLLKLERKYYTHHQ